MFNWFFKLWKAKELMSQAESLPFAIYRATQETVATISLEVFQTNGRLMRGIRKGFKSLELLAQEERDLHFSKDFLGLVTKVEQPLFAEAQASAIAWRVFMYRFIAVLFILSEAALFYVIMEFIIPGLGPKAGACASLVGAGAAMLCLSWGMEHHLKYIYAKQRFAEGLIKPDVLKALNHKRMLGYLSIAMSLGFLLAVSLVRIYLLEKAGALPDYSKNPEGMEAYLIGKNWAGVLNMLLTFILGIYLAKLKMDLFTEAPLNRLYKKWKGVKGSMARIIRGMADMRAQIVENMDVTLNRGWQLVVDTQLIMQREYDAQDVVLYKEYVEIRKQPGFALNYDIFTKHERLLSAFRELYDYAVEHHAHMERFRKDLADALSSTMPAVTPNPVEKLSNPSGPADRKEQWSTKPSKQKGELEGILQESDIGLNGKTH